jgi:hypothetical protein
MVYRKPLYSMRIWAVHWFYPLLRIGQSGLTMMHRNRLRRMCELLAPLFDLPEPIGFILERIIGGRRRDQLRAFLAEMIEPTAHRLALHRVLIECEVGNLSPIGRLLYFEIVNPFTRAQLRNQPARLLATTGPSL